MLTNKRKSTGLKHFNDFEDYNLRKICKILIVFNNIIADMLSNKNLNLIVNELFIRGKKINICLVFLTESYFAVPKKILHQILHTISI